MTDTQTSSTPVDDAANAAQNQVVDSSASASTASVDAGTAPVPEASVSETGATEANNEAAPSLLEKFAADGKDAKPDAEKASQDTQKAEGEKTDDPATNAAENVEGAPEGEQKAELPPVEYKYDLPETMQMDDGQKEEFHKALDEFRADPEKGAQRLVGMADKMMSSYAEHLQNEQWRVFNEMRAEWVKQVMADPVLGGAGYQTSMGVIARMRDKFASSAAPGTKEYEADMKAFDTFLRTTGAGDNIHFLRLLHNVGRKFDEPPLPPAGARPVPESGKRPGESRGARMYPSMQSDSQS